MPERVSKAKFEAEVLKSDVPVLADFYSDGCIPCKRMSPVLYELKEELAGKVKIVKININFDLELAERYEVKTVPTLILFESGGEARRISGAVSKDEIKKLISPPLGGGRMP